MSLDAKKFQAGENRAVTHLLAVALIAVGLTSQATPGVFAVTHHARAVAPGEVVVVDVRSRTPLREVRAEWLGRTVIFYQVDAEQWQGLAPIDVEAQGGRHSVFITARTLDGKSLGREYPMTIAKRVFPTRRITVAPEFVEPPAEARPRIERERKRVEGLFAAPTAERLWTTAFVAPVPGQATSSFGRRSIINGQPRGAHTGTDFQAATGTPVVAPNDGRVVLAEDLYFAGQTVIIDHGLGLYSYLAHLSELTVSEGSLVKRGGKVGLSGATGRVTGPHLHWTMRIGAARVDPLSLIAAFAENAQPSASKAGRGHR
jgi:murein DD-endopeptidase MepM/ murein hydrolase activator NlpD